MDNLLTDIANDNYNLDYLLGSNLLERDFDMTDGQKKELGRRYIECNLHTRKGISDFIKLYDNLDGNMRAIAKHYAVSPQTLYKWRNNDERVRQAIALVNESKIDEITKRKMQAALIRKAVGYTYSNNTTHYDGDGAIIKDTVNTVHVTADVKANIELQQQFNGVVEGNQVYIPQGLLVDYLVKNNDVDAKVEQALKAMSLGELGAYITALGTIDNHPSSSREDENGTKGADANE